MEYYIFLSLLIPIIFFINRKVLRERNSFLVIFLVCLVFAIMGILSIYNSNNNKLNFGLYLFSPLYSLLLYRLMLIPFWKRKHRDPKIPPRELFYSGDVSLFADKFFMLIFLLLSIIAPTLLITRNYW